MPDSKAALGCAYMFSPVWYPDIIEVCNESLDSLGVLVYERENYKIWATHC